MKSFTQEETDRLNSAASRIERSIDRLKKDHGSELALDAAAIKYQQAHPDLPYSACLEVAMAENKELAGAFIASMGHVSEAQARSFGIESDYLNEDAGSIAAEKELDKLALAWLANHPTVKDYKAALDAVMAAHPDLAMLWLKRYDTGTQPRAGKPWTPPASQHADDDDSDDEKGAAGKKIDALCQAWLREHPQESFEKAMGAVRDSHPELWKKYSAEKN